MTGPAKDVELPDIKAKILGSGSASSSNPLHGDGEKDTPSRADDDENGDGPSESYHEKSYLLTACINTTHVPWIHYTLPYALSIGFVNFNTWGMLSAVTPFAMHHAAVGVSDSFLLALCYEIGCFTLVAGDISTAFVKLPFKIILPMFGILSFVIYLAAFKCPGFDTPSSGPILVIVFCVGRFMEAHIVTESFRAIATHVPEKHREDASRALGIADQ
ncbi:unnamed protein product, partial [Symbiodinium microadriaticum]